MNKNKNSFNFLEILEKQLEKRAERFSKYKAEPALKPSSIGHPCTRKIYYDYWRFEQDTPFDARSEITMNIGSKLHEMVQGWFKGSDEFITYKNPKNKYDVEFPVTAPDLLIKKGKIDGVLRLNNKLWLLEVKTIHDIGFDFLTEPKKDHIFQGMLYVYLFERNLRDNLYAGCDESLRDEQKNPLEVEGIIFLYLNKNSAKLKAYNIKKDDEVFAEILKKIETIALHVEQKALPAKRATKLCNYCPYFNACKAQINIGDSNEEDS